MPSVPLYGTPIRRELRTVLQRPDWDDETFWQTATPLGKWCLAAITIGLVSTVLVILLNLDVG
jgi:hypothetical protein